MVVSELRGEKIDIIPFNEEPARFVAKALSPARVREVLVDDEAKQATVIVPDDQLSLAIGKDGLNARLAARLTGWRVDIRSETEFAEEEAEMGYEEEEVSGRCAAILANGKRCPNASLPGSRYCGLPAHQALADQGRPTTSCRPRRAASGGRARDAEEPVAEEAAAEESRRRRRGRLRSRGGRGRGARRGAASAPWPRPPRRRSRRGRPAQAEPSRPERAVEPASASCVACGRSLPQGRAAPTRRGPAERCGRTRRAAPRAAAPTSAPDAECAEAIAAGGAASPARSGRP